MWNQGCNPFGNATLATIAAAPVVTPLLLTASNKVKAHIAAVVAPVVANLAAIFIFTMPAACRRAREDDTEPLRGPVTP